MAIWQVGGTVVGSTYIGEYEADSGQEAIRKAKAHAGISLCHQCAKEISDPEIESLWAENTATGECITEETEATGEINKLRTRWEKLKEALRLGEQRRQEGSQEYARLLYKHFAEMMEAIEKDT